MVSLTYIINGALTGLLYALIAMSFVIIYRSARVFNFAQGEIIIVGAFLIWTYMSVLDLDGGSRCRWPWCRAWSSASSSSGCF